MSLYIRDKDVDALAKEVQQAIDAPTKTEAVRVALQNELDRAQRKPPLAERIRKYQDMAGAFGPLAGKFDEKAFMDDLWGD